MSEMSRRRFLKTGSKGIALATIPIIFRANPLAAIIAPGGGIAGLKDYYEHFGVTSATINQVMATALGKGGDFCDLYFQHRIVNNIALEDNIVSRASTDVALGVGIRVVRENQTGYSFTEEITPEAMKEAAQTAANIANENKAFKPVELKLHETPNYYSIETRWEDVGIDSKIPLLQKINDKMFSEDKRVIKSQVYFGDTNDYVLIATSDGRITYDYRPQTAIYAICNAEEDGRRENNYSQLGGRMGIEYYTPENLENLAISAVKNTVNLFEAVKPEGGEMEVVLAAGDAGILLHEAIGHGMEADFNRRGESLFADKVGKRVAEDFVTIVDDGTLPNYRGSLNVDDEGNDTEVTYLVEKGILKTYMHDKISARHYEVKPTGNGRRETFRHMPIPRMRNTYMLNGPYEKEEIIKSVKKGLYAEKFTNGQVKIGPGDFTFYLKTGRLIEDGKLTRPVKDVNIIGNGPEVLKNMVMVGNDLNIDTFGGICGKGGQRAPVTDGLPTTKVSAITVGGVSS